MTYPYHQRFSANPSRGSDNNWMKPPYQRSHLKRRCSSPSLFPRKVHVTEEKVAEELENLSLHSKQRKSIAGHNLEAQKPDFLLDGTRRLKTFQELEDSIEIDASGEKEIGGLKGTVEIAPELATEIKKLGRKILSTSSYRLSPKRMPVNPCQELVLWKPPTGSIIEVLNAVKEAALAQEAEEDYNIRNCGPRLDRIDEEPRTDLQECSMADFTDEQPTVSLPKPVARTLHYSPALRQDPQINQRTLNPFDDSEMEISMDL